MSILKLYGYRAVRISNENENVYEKYIYKQRHLCGYSIQLLKIIQCILKKTLYRCITGTATR